MKPKTDWIEKRRLLRTKVDDMLSKLAPVQGEVQPGDVLMHELLVHKVELEMQIEELRRAHDAMEATRDRYLDLYDFAPVGYVTLNTVAMIDDINLTGAAMLGIDRARLINRRFSKFVSPNDEDLWHRLFVTFMKRADTDKQTFVLELVRADGTRFHAYLDGQRRQLAGAATVLRLALFDISKIRQAEEAMLAAADGQWLSDPVPPPAKGF